MIGQPSLEYLTNVHDNDDDDNDDDDESPKVQLLFCCQENYRKISMKSQEMSHAFT